MKDIREVLIIGAGPAGLAAAMQLQRYGVDFCLLEGQRAGGLLWNANLVENYPGFPGGVTGAQLARSILTQCERLGVEVVPEAVSKLEYETGYFEAQTPSQEFRGMTCVIASGTKAVALPGIAIPEGVQARVLYEGYALRDQEGACIAVIGAGDLAFDYALNLSKNNQVILLNRGTRPSCLPLLWERAERVKNLQYKINSPVRQILSPGKEKVRIECGDSGGASFLEVDYLLIAIGRQPQLDFVGNGLKSQMPELEKTGLLYWAGDVKNGIYRQASIAVGDGILAAMKIYRYLKGQSL